MKRTNLRRHNLNALPVLREILKHGSLTRAAEAMSLTQPALSNILKQLRQEFDDPLIVRQGQKMHLTPRALALVEPLDAALQSLERLLAPSFFDAAQSERHFRIATTDFMMALIGAPLSEMLVAQAPQITVSLQAASPGSVQALMSGGVDMIVTPTVVLASGVASQQETDNICSEIVRKEPLVSLARADDAVFSAGLTLEAYLARPHAVYVFGDGSNPSMEQVVLQRLGLKQREMLQVASYSALPAIVERTGLLALLPESSAREASRHRAVQFASPPFGPIEMSWSMVWHRREDRSPEMLWLRNAISKAAG